jgi:hypothetical protein
LLLFLTLLLLLVPLKFRTLYHVNVYVPLQLYEETRSQRTFVTQQNLVVGHFVWLVGGIYTGLKFRVAAGSAPSAIPRGITMQVHYAHVRSEM